mmetsp:Transcript_17361/g.54918  ORF Transcript_17361/g.54918 Transcript_17361/m.54918 type:complete len:124 (-) Transcript_17361:138-509(-)
MTRGSAEAEAEPVASLQVAHVPVRVLAQSDLDRSLAEVLETIHSMDAVMPEEGDDAQLPRPFLLFSGWPPDKMLYAVRKFRDMVALRQVQQEPMAAMAVPRAVGKAVRQLVDEIHEDFKENNP